MKVFFISLCFIFLFQGFFLDVTKSPQEKEAIFGLANAKAERFKKVIELYNLKYSSKDKLYYNSKKNILEWLIKHDERFIKFVDYLPCVILIENSNNTFEEIQNIEKVMIEKNINSAIIVTDPPHSKRVQIFIELFTKKLKGNYIIVSSEPKWWNKHFYFTNWYAIKFVFLETIKIPYNLIKYSLFF